MHIVEYKFSLIFKYMGLAEDEIRPEASFVKDFDFGDFQFNCLVYYIGSYFKINIQESDYPELSTIGSSMNFVKQRLQQTKFSIQEL